MTDEPIPVEETPAMPDQLSFDYIKGNFFHVVHTDGVFGGLSGPDKVNITIFSERRAIPQRTIHELAPDGTLGPEVVQQRVGKEGYVRELEVDLVMNCATAKIIRTWLDDKIRQMEEIQKAEVRPSKDAK